MRILRLESPVREGDIVFFSFFLFPFFSRIKRAFHRYVYMVALSAVRNEIRNVRVSRL